MRQIYSEMFLFGEILRLEGFHDRRGFRRRIGFQDIYPWKGWGGVVRHFAKRQNKPDDAVGAYAYILPRAPVATEQNTTAARCS